MVQPPPRPFYNFRQTRALPLTMMISCARGVAAGTLAATLFVGMVLIIVLFSLMQYHPSFVAMGYWAFGGAAGLITVALLLAYRVIHGHKLHRFQKGRPNPLLLRSMMRDCLERDCQAIETRLNSPDRSSVDLFNELLQAKMENILKRDCHYMADIRERFIKSGLKPLNGENLHLLFQSHQEYEQGRMPDELTLISNSVVHHLATMGDKLARLKTYRRTLFTIMGDYRDILTPTPRAVERLCQTYPYRPPTLDAAERIVFAMKVISYLKAEHEGRTKSKLRDRIEMLATERIWLLRRTVLQYRQAWQCMVDAYENLPYR
jgi:hypothetical protein